MLHKKLEEYNSAFKKIMEELEEPEMPEDPKSSAPSTTDETPKKSRGQYQKPTDKDIKKLLYLYFIRGLIIEKASKIHNYYNEILALLSYNCNSFQTMVNNCQSIAPAPSPEYTELLRRLTAMEESLRTMDSNIGIVIKRNKDSLEILDSVANASEELLAVIAPTTTDF
ncbi:hypothetical protein PHYBLDRAFT_166894 [Phycomyces blakesleeanus NRRL 1555(-)]|uniref:Uncharacterized protein n=1 Tax=Phycomyces blakesleeanus (strain ATCC 8743b / DSM 1359 / FGSC 10004 / NBRC 33097 / NRRL 1555) TaxID=763407 RepID=A0A162XM40_PHYB8|nr:hypothetical protein PHYBLDRAFT_166894 [Phycomyces blakesleeanus NRRL 1555(-)]OAD75665.1 hypothetical protein PHYBLDRAFT_166894 [Phycomyces blakesleeanus NRRL 1555(-)]|eukprot:XP_018293705.1 hypothetical protein PHYBLDRAFT_166894 [Phycomyces blakesleeanus NRRL 1555(-)]